eukprot:CAMPEP_0118952728 /NCGR_PEP_ID=MMETSP1169-20130426/55364_1 /TAXON_ID=36882 /ORGANISM="Pyramimonas obovata, Strain CCMP722" /LENGTH=124 /DNA_ID=CAMNT_0006900049 /DNA_START=18 /DNA_END=392 /DNA_ORIENTATION=+
MPQLDPQDLYHVILSTAALATKQLPSDSLLVATSAQLGIHLPTYPTELLVSTITAYAMLVRQAGKVPSESLVKAIEGQVEDHVGHFDHYHLAEIDVAFQFLGHSPSEALKRKLSIQAKKVEPLG